MATFNETYMGYQPEYEYQNFETDEFEWEAEAENGVFNEAELMELAEELLTVNSEAELDQFLGNLLGKKSPFGKFLRSSTGKALGGVLKTVAKTALPLAGGAIGTALAAPLGPLAPLGGMIGGGIASAAGGALGLEAEMMDAEEREFEGAKQFVKLAGDAIKTAAAAPANSNPLAVAQSAAMSAVQKHAPHLIKPIPKPAPAIPQKRASGRWVLEQDGSIRILGFKK
ncbi:MAG: hypothetical protein BWK73_06710 [Thiothrix lacustris]|uniref:Uncharacterized protein n=1 Tax=Thiothrix lacustris TaxID=525917 RepID=A0A1Y1QWB6_9GAMM|nr:MAG: hypothetical protein BWK73_06710 [Thiothrix lacustris]